MLYHLNNKNSAIRARLEHLKKAISERKVLRTRDLARFVFLCGANKNKTSVSERRQALLRFAEKQLPHTQFFIAEPIFEFLTEEGHGGNILDIEREISKLADNVLIVLESNSAFCELGAFSYDELRKKLIVINDLRFKHSDSFINKGPLLAIKEAAGDRNIIHYKMSENGVQAGDGIGDIFPALYALLNIPLVTRSKPVVLEEYDPKTTFNKESIQFVHDLIYLTGPVTWAEFVRVLIFLFGNADYKAARRHLGMLVALNLIRKVEGPDRSDSYFYSLQDIPYLQYHFDLDAFLASFRNFHLQMNPKRFYAA